MKSFIIAALIGVAAMASAANTEPGGTYGRSKIYDIGNPGYQAEAMDFMNMPCCKNMQDQGACKKMLKAKKK